MRTILLVRHGQTAFNAGGTIQGHLPTPLNALGHHQATLLAARLKAFRPEIEVLLTSDLRRAEQTAAPIEAALGLIALRDARWRERSFGSLEGKTVGDTEIWRAATGTLDPPGAEPIPALEARVKDALLSVAAAHADRRAVAVVTHGGAMRTVLRLLAEGHLPLVAGHPAIEVGPILNASILHLTIEAAAGESRWRVVTINDVEHLATKTQSSKDAG